MGTLTILDRRRGTSEIRPRPYYVLPALRMAARAMGAQATLRDFRQHLDLMALI